MFTAIKQIIPFVASRLKIQPELEIKEVLSFWPDLVSGFFGGKEKLTDASGGEESSCKVKNKIRPLFIKNKTLFIECPNSVWAGELQARKENIIEKINQRMRNKKVEKIKLVF